MTVAEAAEPTAEPSSRSRENSTLHGLSGAGVVMPDSLRIDVNRRKVEYTVKYDPKDRREHDLIELAALGFARFQSVQGMIDQRTKMRSLEAFGGWPLLRSLDTLERVKKLRSAPERVSAQLKSTLGGVEWLLSEWRLLRLGLDKVGGWTYAQQLRAQDLAGVPKGHRHLDPLKLHGGTLEERTELVDRQIAELQGLLEGGELQRRDAIVRQEIIDGDGLEHDPGHDRLALYERRALRMYEKAIQELKTNLEARKTAVAEVAPPFASELTSEEYLEAIDDPDSVGDCPAEVVSKIPSAYQDRMSSWLKAKGLKLDATTALRGVLGRLRRNGLVLGPTIVRPVESRPERVEDDDAARSRAEQRRKDRRKGRKRPR